MKDFAGCGNVKIDYSRCVKNTFSKSTCRDCYNVCITEAIKLTPTPKIDSSACIQCGLCYAVCRFSTINIKKDNIQLLKETKDNKTIDIGCIFSNSEIKIACISRLSEDLLFSWFFNDKKVIIKKGECKRCKFKNTLSYFYSSLRKSIALSKAINKTPNIKIKTDKAKNVFIPKETLSRRDILSNLKPKSTTAKREIIINLLKDNIKIDINYEDAVTISISNECNLCGICQHVCPTNAILISKDNENGHMYFDASSCVACMACEEACIRKAITINHSTISQLTSKPKEIFKIKKRICKECKSIFYSNKETDTCHACSIKSERKNSLMDFFKNI